uniref:Uncharacterized protein n=1 Tax=viral metagenome TaxID=1070528 RepID=A0A6C0ANW8_9ZZZZ
MLSSEFVFLLIVLCIGFLLIVYPNILKEGFEAGMSGVRCGIDLPTCNVGLQCMNGFCGSPMKPYLMANQLPVYP